MRTVFADTYYFLALLDSREKQHAAALSASRDSALRIVTTEWVLMEFGDAYSDPKDRPDFVALYEALVNHSRVKVVPADTQLMQRGIRLFAGRADKSWSLTDCTSFIVMDDEGIREALTGDRHFEQAGYIALLM
jgi:predicted nucleic acid-binding protein